MECKGYLTQDCFVIDLFHPVISLTNLLYPIEQSDAKQKNGNQHFP